MSKKTSWGNVADWYDDVVNEGDSYQLKVILPNLMRLLAPEKGKEVLDIACGQGFFAHATAAAGARVTGIDVAPELIAIAQKHASHNEDFYVMSADDLSKLSSASFDAAYCVLALQNIEQMTKALKEAGRVVKKGGKLILVLNHPAFRIPGKASWGVDDAAGVQYRRIDEYMSESRKAMDMRPGETAKTGAPSELTYSFHRPLQAYSKSLANAGFAILRIEEWVSHKQSEQGPKKAMEDKARREIPIFMCLECARL